MILERRTKHRRIKKREKLTNALLFKISIWAISIVVIASAITGSVQNSVSFRSTKQKRDDI